MTKIVRMDCSILSKRPLSVNIILSCKCELLDKKGNICLSCYIEEVVNWDRRLLPYPVKIINRQLKMIRSL